MNAKIVIENEKIRGEIVMLKIFKRKSQVQITTFKLVDQLISDQQEFNIEIPEGFKFVNVKYFHNKPFVKVKMKRIK